MKNGHKLPGADFEILANGNPVNVLSPLDPLLLDCSSFQDTIPTLWSIIL